MVKRGSQFHGSRFHSHQSVSIDKSARERDEGSRIYSAYSSLPTQRSFLCAAQGHTAPGASRVASPGRRMLRRRRCVVTWADRMYWTLQRSFLCARPRVTPRRVRHASRPRARDAASSRGQTGSIGRCVSGLINGRRTVSDNAVIASIFTLACGAVSVSWTWRSPLTCRDAQCTTPAVCTCPSRGREGGGAPRSSVGSSNSVIGLALINVCGSRLCGLGPDPGLEEGLATPPPQSTSQPKLVQMNKNSGQC